ncbi:MAG TPA: hypothetical protein VF399_10380 [bacterium]
MIGVLLAATFANISARAIETRDEIIKDLQAAVADSQPLVIRVFVALCDNEYQGIVPVTKKLGNGEDPEHNLYWGAGGGVKTFFLKSDNWRMVANETNTGANILERCIFKRNDMNVYLVADAYRGSAIKEAITDFLKTITNDVQMRIGLPANDTNTCPNISGDVKLVAYVGHNGLMDFSLDSLPAPMADSKPKDVIVLACLSKSYFSDILDSLGGYPLLWTTGLCAPEAYTLKAAIDGWINLESGEEIQSRAAAAYNKYQKCGLKAAKRLFVTGWLR